MTSTTIAAITTPTPLDALYRARSKHSSYQLIHPSLLPSFGSTDGLPAGKHELQRQRWFDRVAPATGRSVLDIGANTGFFTFAALAAGATRVRSQEGNPAHAAFIDAAGRAIGASDRLEVVDRYFPFAPDATDHFDLTLCLNVVHHLGDDFGDAGLTMPQAKERMLAAINALAHWSDQLVLQVGFNWKGDPTKPLFAGGEKAALIDFVQRGTAAHWRIDATVVADAATREYVPVDAGNLPRNDSLGEFLNRPLFLMTALRG